jgi:NDP-sugar pyrophosphorylase family protein
MVNVLEVGCELDNSKIGSYNKIGPKCVLIHSVIGDRAEIKFTDKFNKLFYNSLIALAEQG